MSESWQTYEISKSSIKEKQENGQKDVSEDNRQTFEQIWNKEKGITMGERKINAANLENGINRQLFRPKSVCLGTNSNNGKNDTETERKINPNINLKTEANENLVITENLPAVSDVIRSFEEPQLKEPRNPLNGQANRKTQMHLDNEKYQISKKGDIALISNEIMEKKKLQKEKRKSLPITILSDQEIFKQKMYDEYMSKLAERIERRQQKTIRVSQSNEIECPEEIRFFDLENEFINKVKERREKLNLAHDKKEADKAFMESLQKQCQEFSDYWREEISNLENSKKEENNFDKCKDGGTESSTTSKRSSVQLIFDTSSNVESLPKHLQEFLMVDQEEFPDFYDGKFYDDMPSSVVFSPNFKATAPRPGVWSPAQGVQVQKTETKKENEERKKLEDEPIPPVWTPKASPVLEKKEFRPINFESPTLPRKKYIQDDKRESSVPPPWQQPGGDKLPELAKSPSSPALILPKAPNPTVTLLQKAREGHLPRGAHYLNSDMNDSPASDGTSIEKLEIVSTIKNDRPRKIESAPKKIIGIGPTTKEGIPLVLRSEVTEENKEKWYKRMYDSLHKAGQDDDYVTVKYRTSPSRKGIYNYQQSSRSGYLSEPELLTYDLSTNKYVSLDRKRVEKNKEDDYACITLPRSRSSPPRRDFAGYKNQPGRIEDYEPGRSSISEAEANKEEGRNKSVQKTPVSPRSFTNFASGYISDPQYVYKRTDEEIQSPNSEEQKEAYRIIQKGGEIPLKGLRKPAPTRPKDIDNFDFLSTVHEKSPDSPRKYVESEVTIHYKSPVRSEAKAMLSEDELARRQAESMKRIYKEERRRKYLQELQDMNSRRHTDNFTPSQKSPIPLNRYDDFPFNDSSLYTTKNRDYSTDPVLVARGLYDFVGRRPRELAFRRGDIIFIIRRLDKNWCEGELNGAVGLFPLSYVEVIPYNEINMKFGRARAKYDFVPQTSLELAAHKGDMIILIRKIDENWFEGRIGDKTGIIPASYCHILAMPQASRIPIRSEKVNKPVAVPAAHSLIHNGSSLSSKHFYAPHLSGPNSPGRSTISSASANYHDDQVSPEMLIDEALMQLDEEFDLKRSTAQSASQPLNVRINPRPEPALYQVMFNHVPNNDDELELVQGETVSVVEKCGDGWYIGSKTSDGKLGIFPGTHVRRIAPEFV